MIKDVSEHFPNCTKAEQKDLNVLILTKLEHKRKRLDGEYGDYELEYRWLSQDDVVCVKGSDFTLWLESEIDLTKSLFEQVVLV